MENKFNEEFGKKVTRINKKFSKYINEMFKISLINIDAVRELCVDEPIKGKCYYIFAPKLGLHTNAMSVYFDGNDYWCNLGLCETDSCLFQAREGLIEINVETFKKLGVTND